MRRRCCPQRSLPEPCLFNRTPGSLAKPTEPGGRLMETRLTFFLLVPVPSCGLASYLPVILGDTPCVLTANPSSLIFFFILLNLAQLGFCYSQPKES